MNKKEIASSRSRLKNLFEKVSLYNQDYETQSQWARYLSVLVYGYLERSIRILLINYCEKKAPPYVANYAERNLRRFQNAKLGKIFDMMGSFSPLWVAELERNTTEEMKAAIESVVNLRHKIAHGENVGITYAGIKKYYQEILKFVELIESICDS